MPQLLRYCRRLGAALLLAAPVAALAQTPGVGIGTTAPDVSAALDIVSSDKGALLPRVALATGVATPATGLIVFQTTAPAGFYYNAGTPTTPDWQRLVTASGTDFIQNQNATDQTANFRVSGDGRVGGTLTAGGSVVVDATDANVGTFTSVLRFGSGTGEGIGSGRLSGPNRFGLDLYTGFLPRLSIANGGNVGIGTTTPVTTLDVRTTDGSARLTVGTTANTGGGIVFGNANHGIQRGYPTLNADNHVGFYTTAGNVYLSGNNARTDQFVLTNGGNVGIGTGSPGQKLFVAGDFVSAVLSGALVTSNNPAANGTAQIVGLYGNGGLGPQMRFQGVGSGFMDVGENAAGDFVVEGTDAARLTVQNAGNVGIGTSTPAAKLDIQAGADNNGNGDQVALGFSYRGGGYRHYLRSRHNTGNGGNALDFYLNNSNTDAGSSAPGTGNIQVLTLDNNSGPRVGIGTTDPTQALDVNGNVRVRSLTTAGLVVTDANGNLSSSTSLPAGVTGDNLGNHSATQNIALNDYDLRLRGATDTNHGLAWYGFTKPWNGVNVDGPVLYGAAGGVLGIGGGQQSVLTWNNSGNVGIGTSTPAQRLDVAGNAAVSNFVGIGTASPSRRLHVVNDNGGGGGADDYVFDEYGPGDQSLYLRRAGGTAAAPADLANGDYLGGLSFVPRFNGGFNFEGSSVRGYYTGTGTSLSTDLRLITSDAERLRIDGTGNVGIGTSTPHAPLQLASTLANRKLVLYETADNDHEFLGFGINNNTLRYQVANAGDNHVFFRGDGTAASVELMRINGNGNVGIGRNAPQASLEVARGTGTDGTAVFYGTARTSHFNYSTAEDTYIRGGKATSNVYLNDNGGNVGIGTTSPSARLDVDGSTRLRGLTTAGVVTTDALGNLSSADAAGSFIQNQNTADQAANFRISGNGTVGGRVGIGITNPGYQLTNTNVNTFGSNGQGGNSGSLNWAANQGGYVAQFFNGNNTNGGSGVAVKINGTDAGATALDVSKGTVADATGTSLFVVKAGGNVGIGNANPNSRLSISPGAVEPKITLYDGGSTTNHYGLGVSGNQLNYHVLGTGDRHVFYAGGKNGNGTELMRIQGNGNVGIGTTTPGQRLSVNGGVQAATFGAFSGNTGIDQGAHLQWNRSGTEGETWLINHIGLANPLTEGGIRFAGITTSTGTTPTEWARFTNNGNFGLGTPAPSAKLDVDGSTRLRGLTTPGVVTTDALGNLSSTAAPSGTDFIQNTTTQQASSNFNISGNGTVGGTLTAANAVVTTALTGNGATIGTAVGVGVRADGGLNLGQNTTGNNIYLGYRAGAANTTGTQNLFVGDSTGLSNTTGRGNFFAGYRAGQANTDGGYNVALGFWAGRNNTTGAFNTFIGVRAGEAHTTGARNHFVGYRAGQSITTTSNSHFDGYRAGELTTTGLNNHFSGYMSGNANTSGGNNTFVGNNAGRNNTTGSSNTVLGYNSGPAVGSPALTNATALGANVALTTDNTVVLGNGANVGIGTTTPATKLDVAGTTQTTNAIVTTALTGAGANIGSVVGLGVRADGGLNIGQNTVANVFLGYQNGQANTGSGNTFVGYRTGPANTSGLNNTFVGGNSGLGNIGGLQNTFVGTLSGSGNTAGDNNAFFGQAAGQNNLTGSNNTVVGSSSGPTSGNLSNATALGANVALTTSNTVVLGNNANVGIGTSAPATKLDVRTTDGTARLTVGTTTNTGGGIAFGNTGHGIQRGYPTLNADNNVGFYTTAGNLYLGANGAVTDQFVLTTGGNVGIGTTVAPTQKLDVNGNARVGTATAPGKVLTPTTGTNNMLAVAYGQMGGGGLITYSTSGNFTLAHPNPGVYVLTFPASSGLNTVAFGDMPVVATLFGSTPGFVTTSGGTGTITVRTFNTTGTATDYIFNISVFAQ